VPQFTRTSPRRKTQRREVEGAPRHCPSGLAQRLVVVAATRRQHMACVVASMAAAGTPSSCATSTARAAAPLAALPQRQLTVRCGSRQGRLELRLALAELRRPREAMHAGAEIRVPSLPAPPGQHRQSGVMGNLLVARWVMSVGWWMAEVQANCRTHRPHKLKRLISLCANPASILSVPIQTVRQSP
jgi:hypothetical protein